MLKRHEKSEPTTKRVLPELTGLLRYVREIHTRWEEFISTAYANRIKKIVSQYCQSSM